MYFASSIGHLADGMLGKMEYWNNGIKKQKNQFHTSDHFQPIIPVFQPSNVPEFKGYHQSLLKSTHSTRLAHLHF